MSEVSQLALGPVLSIAAPLVLCVATWVPALRGLAVRLAPWSALPSLVLALRFQGREAYFPDILLGTRLFSADAVTQAFLLLTAVVWTCAGWASRSYLEGDARRDAYWGFFLASLGGSLGVVLAQDMASFYGFLMLMTFASAGLVLHEGTPAAHRAGVVYLVMSVLGELFLLALIVLLGRYVGNAPLTEVPQAVADAPHRDVLVSLILAGFGVKAGLVPLHLWLPLAHPVAPTPASAALSGAMIKAGLLGWLRFLPLDVYTSAAFGSVVAGLGLCAAVYGAVLGVTQTEPKAVLAYSSVSQMGFMTVAVGAGWASPTADAARAAVSLFALHHAFAKGALFLGVGVFQKAAGRASRWVMCGLVLGALEIAGGPFTGGAFAKAELSALIHTLPAGSTLLSWGISCAAIGSTLLMLRFLQRLSAGAAPQRERPGPSLWLPWALLLVFDLTLQLRTTEKGLAASVLSQPAKLWAASWPILAGVIVAWAAQRARVRLPAIPEGDVLVWIERGLRGVRTPALHASDWLRGQAARIGTSFRHQRARVGRTLVAWGLQGEARLRSFEIVGTLLLGLLALLLLR